MEKKRYNLWDLLFLIGTLAILIWALLKSLRIINTPIFIEMIPYYGLGLVFLSAYKKWIKFELIISNTFRKVNQLKKDLKN